MKKFRMLIVSLMFVIAAGGVARATQNSAVLSGIDSDEGYTVRHTEENVPLTKGGSYTVRLLTTRDGNSRFDSSIILSIESAEGEKVLFSLGDIAGYDADFKAERFADKNKSELFLSMASGGSGGYGSFYVIDFDGRDARVIYDSDKDSLPSHVTGKFTDGYRCVVRIHGEDDNTKIDLSPRKALYDGEGVYNPAGGKLLKAVDIWGGSYGSMAPTKHRGVGGSSALRGEIAYSGLYNADRILTVVITQSYDNGRWRPVAYEFKPWHDLKTLQ